MIPYNVIFTGRRTFCICLRPNGVVEARAPKGMSLRQVQELVEQKAEEGVIRLLLLDGTLADKCRELSQEAFSSPFLGRIYRTLTEAWDEGQALTAASLAAHCTPEEMGHLSGVLQRPECLRGNRELS